MKKEIVSAFQEKCSRQFINLKWRWEDEKQYEDFADYITVVKKMCEDNGAEFLKMSKRPFQVTFKLAGQLCEMKATTKSVEVCWYK